MTAKSAWNETKKAIRGTIDIGEKIAGLFIDTAAIGGKALDMEKDEEKGDDVYNARQDAWQSNFGYNKLYDFMLDVGTDAKAEQFKFNHNGQELAIWAWKGDYINLGSGAEMGIYKKSKIPGHWDVDKELALPMSLSLKHKNGDKIFDYKPDEKQWWITGFNPNMKDIKPEDMVATYTIDFSDDIDMYNSFSKSEASEDHRWNFDSKTHTATLKW